MMMMMVMLMVMILVLILVMMMVMIMVIMIMMRPIMVKMMRMMLPWRETNNPKRHKPHTYKRFSSYDASCS